MLGAYLSSLWVASTLMFFVMYSALRFFTQGSSLSLWDICGTTALYFIWFLITYSMAGYLTFGGVRGVTPND